DSPFRSDEPRPGLGHMEPRDIANTEHPSPAVGHATGCEARHETTCRVGPRIPSCCVFESLAAGRPKTPRVGSLLSAIRLASNCQAARRRTQLTPGQERETGIPVNWPYCSDPSSRAGRLKGRTGTWNKEAGPRVRAAPSPAVRGTDGPSNRHAPWPPNSP